VWGPSLIAEILVGVSRADSILVGGSPIAIPVGVHPTAKIPVGESRADSIGLIRSPVAVIPVGSAARAASLALAVDEIRSLLAAVPEIEWPALDL